MNLKRELPAVTNTVAEAPVRSFSLGFYKTLAVLLALLHALLAVTATVGKSITADETGYLAAGTVYNIRHDYRLQPENGILPQRWVALPLSAASTALPGANNLAWQKADVWRFGYEFLYTSGVPEGEDLFWARTLTSIISAATALLIFSWSYAYFGLAAGFFSEALYTFAPSFLAHGALATSDLVITFFLLAAAGAFYRCLNQASPGRVSLSALLLGGTCVAKYSAVLLLPIYALVLMTWWLQREHKINTTKLALRLSGIVLAHLAGALVVIWAFYGFRYSAFNSGDGFGAGFERPWSWTLATLGPAARLISWARQYHLLPESWLYGFSYAVASTRERSAFLNGQYSIKGWAYYFPYTVLVKTTIPVLLLAGGTTLTALWIGGQRLRVSRGVFFQWLWPYSPLLALFIVYWVSSLLIHLNIGHRHILPVYPVVFIGTGGLIALGRRFRPLLYVCGVGLIWQIGVSFSARPNYLAYFNPIAGGTENGWRHLVDSSLDWGQDLPALAARLRRETPDEAKFLAYFGTGNPTYEGVTAERILVLPELGPRHTGVRLRPGLYIISATLFQQVYSSIHGDWSLTNEKEFERLRAQTDALLVAFNRRAGPATSAAPGSRPAGSELWLRYEELRLARLCYYLRARGPDETINGSLLLFRVSDGEIQAAVGGTLREWIRGIEDVVAKKSRP